MSPEKGRAEADSVLERERTYYEDLYSGFAIAHFQKSAVVAFREYLVARLLRATAASRGARVLSIGCGVGDTELLLAPHVAHVTGIDLSPAAIHEANRAALEKGVRNVTFRACAWPAADLDGGPFDLVLAIFFLHHLPDPALARFPFELWPLLNPGGSFYALEPSSRRLSGFLGKLIVPRLMKKYQTEDERQLQPKASAAIFRQAGFSAETRWFDFCSTPLAGLFPSWASGYRMARRLDGALTTCPGLRGLSSNFELLASRPPRRSQVG